MVPLASGGSAWAYLPAEAPSSGTGSTDGQGPSGGPRRVALVVSGLGSVATALLRLIDDRASDLAARHGLSLAVVAVVDSRGAAVDPDGLDLAAVLAAKAGGGSSGGLPGVGRPGADVPQVLAELDARGARAGVLVEAGPADLVDGGAGLTAVLAARQRDMGVVLANKAPLVVAWEQVTGAGNDVGAEPTVRYSACVGAALPTVDLARSVLVSATATRLEIVLNSTCQRVLGDVERGLEVEEAIAGASCDQSTHMTRRARRDPHAELIARSPRQRARRVRHLAGIRCRRRAGGGRRGTARWPCPRKRSALLWTCDRSHSR